MKALICEPKKNCYEKEIETDLKSLQKIVGGYIEFVCPFNDNVAIICNEEGKLTGLEPNRVLTNDGFIPYDYVCGTFIFIGLNNDDDENDDDFSSLTNNQIKKYKKILDGWMM